MSNIIFFSEIHTKHIKKREHHVQFLGVFAKFRTATISFVTSLCTSVHPSAWNNSAPTGHIFMRFYVWVFLQNLS